MTHALFTTLGTLPADKLGMIPPHEHGYVDLRTPDAPGLTQLTHINPFEAPARPL